MRVSEHILVRVPGKCLFASKVRKMLCFTHYGMSPLHFPTGDISRTEDTQQFKKVASEFRLLIFRMDLRPLWNYSLVFSFQLYNLTPVLFILGKGTQIRNRFTQNRQRPD